MLVQKKIKSVYLGDVKVRPTGWQPGSNTLLYLPLKTGLTNQITGSLPSSSSGIAFTTVDGVQCAYSNDNYAVYLLDIPSTHTSSCWMKTLFDNYWMIQWTVDAVNSATPSYGTAKYYYDPYISSGGKLGFYNGSSDILTSKSIDTSWHLITCVHSGATLKYYIDGVYYTSGTVNDTTFKRLQLFTRDVSSQRFKGYASEFIIENKERTAEEIAKYYNQTKSNYGL